MRLKVTTLRADYKNIEEALAALNITCEQIASPEVASDAGVTGRFVAQDDDPGHGIVLWNKDFPDFHAVGTRDLKKGDKVVWFDPSLPQT